MHILSGSNNNKSIVRIQYIVEEGLAKSALPSAHSTYIHPSQARNGLASKGRKITSKSRPPLVGGSTRSLLTVSLGTHLLQDALLVEGQR